MSDVGTAPPPSLVFPSAWQAAPEAGPGPGRSARARLGDFAALTKPSITRLVVATTAAGFYMGSAGRPDLATMAHALLGTALVASGTNALNQWWERDVDARMQRTRSRPLPAGRLRATAALGFAAAISLAGILYLAAFVNLVTAALAAASLATYVLCYTPLKKRTTLSTVVGAVPGALPILGGWTAATGAVTAEAWLLFAVLALWQMPHFLALAWLYREDYRRGGLVTLGVLDPDGRRTGRQVVAYTLALVGASVALVPWGVSGRLYLTAALVLGIVLLVMSAAMALHPSPRRARRLFLASVIYLPALLMFMVVDKAAP